MKFTIRDIQICGCSNYAFTDEKHPQIAVFTDGGAADKICVKVSHENRTDWEAEAADAIYLNYAGRELAAKTTYQVEVTAYRGTEVSSMQASFDTGFMEENWTATWIEPVQECALPEEQIRFYQIFKPETKKIVSVDKLKPAQEIRKIFILNSLPEKAVLYMTAHGVYELQVNGKKADTRKLAPEISVYPAQLYYQRYDLDGLLQEGENEIRMTVADGWWAGRIGLSGDSCQYGDKLGVLLQLEIFTGLQKMVIASDASFECRESQIRYADLYIGEKWDLTQERKPWKNCVCAEYPMENLKAQSLVPVTVTQELDGRVFTSPKGDLLVDFGQTIAGVLKIEIAAEGKRVITLEHCEALDENGEFFQNIVGRNKSQKDVLVCDKWPVVFNPTFTYHGFRYVRISGAAPEELVSVRAQVIGTPINFWGSFTCSDERLNQLQKNIQWSMRGNFISIPTDCPQREKMGWTGDIQVFAATACLNADVRGFLGKWLENMRAEQRADGEIPHYIPAFPINDAMQRTGQGNGSNTSSAWGDSCILVPLCLYEKTGDLKVLEDNLPMMEKWLGFVERAVNQKPEGYDSFPDEKKDRCRYLWRSGHHFGDWLIPSFMELPDGTHLGMVATCEVISSAFYAVTLRSYQKILEALLKKQDSKALKEKLEKTVRLLEQVKKAVREEYITPDGRIKGDLQGLYVIMLYADIVDGELREKVAARLAALIRENGNRLDTGFVSTPYLMDVLCQEGYKEVAFDLLWQENPPSWLYQVQKGATTIWENWTAILPDGRVTTSSLNHYAFGCVGQWLYSTIGGLKKIDLAKKEILIAPETDVDLEYAHAETRTPYGTVSCMWRKADGRIHLEVTTPLRSTIQVGESSVSVDPGTWQLEF